MGWGGGQVVSLFWKPGFQNKEHGHQPTGQCVEEDVDDIM